MVLPVDTSTLQALTVSQNVTLSWTDDAPNLDPPEVGVSPASLYLTLPLPLPLPLIWWIRAWNSTAC